MTAIASLLDLLFCAFFATRIGRVRSDSPGPVAAMLGWSVSFSSVFFGSYLVLGLVGLLTGWGTVRPPFAAALTAAAALVSWWVTRAPSRSSPPGSRNAIGLAGLDLVPGKLDGASRILVTAVTITFVCAAAMLSAGFPRGYEPKAYHLPIAVHINQSSSLRIWDREYMDALPANASLYYGFLMNLLPERLVSPSDLLFLPLLMVALYGLARWTGADPSAGLIAACGAATIPIVAFSCLEAGADVAGIAFLGAAAFFALAGNALAPRDLLLAGLSAGLAFGFKSVHLVSIGFLLGVVVIRCWRAVGRVSTISVRSALAARGAGLFLAGVLAMSGTWLVRNWMEFQNPIYPIYVGRVFDALGWAKAPDVNYHERPRFQFEWVRSESEWFVYPWVEWHEHNENFKHSSGLGAFFAALVPPAMLVGFLTLFRKSERGKERVAWLLAGSGIVFAVWWVLGDRQPRYLMGGLVYGLPLVGWMIARSSVCARRAIGWIAGVAAVFMLSVVLSTETIDFLAIFMRHGRWARHEFYAYPAEVDRLPAGSTIANLTSRPENFGLFGANHSNRVINARAAFRALGVDAERGDVPPSLPLDARALRRLGATYLFVSATTTLRAGRGVVLKEAGRFAKVPGEERILYLIGDPLSGGSLPASEHSAR